MRAPIARSGSCMTVLLAIPLATVDCAAVVAGYWDFRYRSIPQWLVGVTAVAGVAGQTIRSGWSGFFSAIAAGGAALLVLGILYVAGLMGAGDVKLFAAISCAIGLNELLVFARTTG